MRPALFIFLLSLGGSSLAQDIRRFNHRDNLPRPSTPNSESRPVSDGDDYKDEDFHSNDLRALGAGSALVLSKGKPINIPANTKRARLGGNNRVILGEFKKKHTSTWFTTECYLIMREEDGRTREVTPGARIIIGGGTPTKVKVGSKFSIEVPVESPASIKSIQCVGEKIVNIYEDKNAMNPIEQIHTPIDPEITALQTIFKEFGELVPAPPVPVE